MDVVATEAPDASAVHQALNKIVALHPVLMRSAVGKIVEVGFPQLASLEFPVVLQVESHLKAHGPVIMLALDRILERPSLRMTLDTHVVAVHVIQARRIDQGR